MVVPTRSSLLSSFPRVFWIANSMELFERAAYYGLNSVLAIYLTLRAVDGGLGFTEESVGLLQGILYAFTYGIPILGGVLADRYGYRKMLLVALSLLSIGYFCAGQAGTYLAVFLTLMVMSLGAGLFKPIIAGTVARTTTNENSGFGFGIYYWGVNVGAFIAPLIVTRLKAMSWELVFIASAAYCAAMLLPAFFFFREPPKPATSRSLGLVLHDAVIVLGDARFVLMIFIYSGFWILYFQNFGSILWFLRDFVDARPVDALFASFGIPFKFDVEHVTVINAATIIGLQVVISRIVKNVKPLPTMVAGMAIGALGFICLAFAVNVWLFILGLVVFSIGEMVAAPKYFSYVGFVAPADKAALYMGYAFLYGVFGSLLGSTIGGTLYESMLKPLAGREDAGGTIFTFWMSFATICLCAMVGLIAYNKSFSADTPSSNHRARKIMRALYVLFLVGGGWFLLSAIFLGPEISYKTAGQAVIMLALGLFGLVAARRHRLTSQPATNDT